jgi:glycosyltransferase involved in cell wall biosynthesis
VNILFFSSYFHPYVSGLTTYPKTILSFLAKKNNITVLTFPHKPDLSAEDKLSTDENEIIIKRMPSLFQVSKGYISPQSVGLFWSELNKTDRVILNMPNFEGLSLAILAFVRNKPIICIYHCNVTLGNDLMSRIINVFLNLSVWVQLSLSTTIIAYTRDYVQSIGMMHQFKHKITYTLPPMRQPSVDEEVLKTFLSKKKKKVWIGYAGRIAREKGIEYLVQAIKKLNRHDIEIVFAGPYGKDVAGENPYYEHIVSLLDKSGIPYTFLGNLEGGRLGAFYKAIDILTLPSINQTEAFGIVQAEALMTGTPVIASNLPGVRVPIQKTGMGIIVEPKNSNDLADAVRAILAKPSNYASSKMQTNAQNIFDIKKTYKTFEKIL